MIAFNSLRQHKFIISQFGWARSLGVEKLSPLPRSHQAECKVLAGATISSEAQRALLNFLVADRVQFLVRIGLRSQFSCLLLAKNHSQFFEAVLRALPQSHLCWQFTVGLFASSGPVGRRTCLLHWIALIWNPSTTASSLFKGLTWLNHPPSGHCFD